MKGSTVSRQSNLIELDRAYLILYIRANPDDPQLFQLYFCADCGQFVPLEGLFPALTSDPGHPGHRLAWLPGQDSVPPGPPEGLVRRWLDEYRPLIAPDRFNSLSELAGMTGSSNWVWVLHGPEQDAWLAFLETYLQTLAGQWLLALAGQSSCFFPEPGRVWANSGKAQLAGIS